MTIQQLAATLARNLVTKNRDTGVEYVCRADDAPDWTLDVICHAHGDMLPDDWRYRMIQNVAYMIAERDDVDADDLSDVMYEAIGNILSIYNSELCAWLASNVHRIGYCDEAQNEYGVADNIMSAISQGQHLEYEEIWSLLVEALSKVEVPQ
jgi:hypothetical protein